MTLSVTFVAVGVYLAWITLVGWFLTRLLTTGLSPEETIAWSIAAGLILHVSLYALLLLLRAAPGPKKLLAGEAVVLAAGILFKRHRSASSLRSGRFPVFAVLISGIAVGPYALDVLGSPIDSTDFLAIWGWKAKLIFLSGGVPSRMFHDPFTVWSHPVYPLFVPLCLASVAAVVRSFDSRALFLLYPAFEGATLLAIFGYLRRRHSLVAASAGLLVAALCFPLYRTAWAGTAEVPLAFAFVLAATAVLRLEEDDRWSNRILALVGSTLCATVKQEGSLFAVLLALWMLGREIHSGETSWRNIWRGAWVWPVLPVLAHTLSMRIFRGRVARHDFDFTLLTAGRLLEWLSHWQTVLIHLARVEIATAALPIVAGIIYLLQTRRSKEDWLLIILGFQTLSYAAAASLSAFGPVWGLESAFARTTLTLMPTLAIVLGARAESLRRPVRG